MQILKDKRTLAVVLVAAALILSGTILYPAVSAQQSNPPQVGQQFTITSLKGEARIRDQATDKASTEKAELQLSAVVAAVGKLGFRFDITGGKITIGEESYTVTKGAGAVLKRGGFILLRGVGVDQNGQSVKFAYRGLVYAHGGKIDAMLVGGLVDGNRKIALRFWVQMSKTG